MQSNEQPLSLAVVVGRRLRKFREENDLRQEEVASAAVEVGLGWGRSSIASLEAGSRNLSIEELALLPLMIARLGGWSESIIPLGETMMLAPGVAAKGMEIYNRLNSCFFATEPESPSTSVEEEWISMGAIKGDGLSKHEENQYKAQALTYELIMRDLRPTAKAFEPFGDSELTVRISNKLTPSDGGGVEPQLVRAIGQALWGRPVSEERDARAELKGPYESKRALQSARGHVTRELIDEMQSLLEAGLSLIREREEYLKSIIDDEKLLADWIEKNQRGIVRKLGKIASRAASTIRGSEND